MFFSQATIGKNIKKHTKTNILLFSADIHTYKLTFVSFFYVFFLNLSLKSTRNEGKTECLRQQVNKAIALQGVSNQAKDKELCVVKEGRNSRNSK